MGMIGYFAEIDSEKINQLLESTEKPLMDNIHDTLSGLRRLDIDKRWDFLHFGLTGTSAFDPAKNDPLSRAVLGEHSLEDGIDGFLGLTWNQELAATIDRLESLDRSELRKQFSIKRLNEMEIYPGVTFSEELEGQLFASIMLDMEKLISAYRRLLLGDGGRAPKKTAEHVGGFLTYKLTDYISGIANRTILISGCGHTPSTSTNSAEISTTIPPALYCQFDGASRPGCSGACRYRLTATRR